jgi:predicted nucleic acid-binding protein
VSEASAEPEVILCDSSLVGLQERALTRRGASAHWPAEVVGRLDAAVLALSVFSLAEIRAGRIYANGGQPRSDAQEARLAAFVHIPLDEDILNEYATLHAWHLQGNTTPHNDLWIGATAISRGFPLVSCDSDFNRIAADNPLEHIYLPPKP